MFLISIGNLSGFLTCSTPFILSVHSAPNYFSGKTVVTSPVRKFLLS